MIGDGKPVAIAWVWPLKIQAEGRPPMAAIPAYIPPGPILEGECPKHAGQRLDLLRFEIEGGWGFCPACPSLYRVTTEDPVLAFLKCNELAGYPVNYDSEYEPAARFLRRMELEWLFHQEHLKSSL